MEDAGPAGTDQGQRWIPLVNVVPPVAGPQREQRARPNEAVASSEPARRSRVSSGWRASAIAGGRLSPRPPNDLLSRIVDAQPAGDPDPERSDEQPEREDGKQERWVPAISCSRRLDESVDADAAWPSRASSMRYRCGCLGEPIRCAGPVRRRSAMRSGGPVLPCVLPWAERAPSQAQARSAASVSRLARCSQLPVRRRAAYGRTGAPRAQR